MGLYIARVCKPSEPIYVEAVNVRLQILLYYAKAMAHFSIQERCLESKNLNHLCPIRELLLEVNQVLTALGRPFDHSNRHHAPSNRNCYGYVHQRILLQVLLRVVMCTAAVQHYRYPLVSHRRRLPYRNLYSIFAHSNLYCNEKNEQSIFE